MGIRHLNKYLKEHASSAIKQIQLSDLSGKKIAIDISIYMYKFATDNCLIENMYLMLSIFRANNIVPVFIFDGKPPPEKYQLLKKRRTDKQYAEQEYTKLKNLLENNQMDILEKKEIMNNMDALKKNFVSLKKTDIENVKNLIRHYGATYYDAPEEADAVCALLSLENKVWACLSEDTDMFVYGCPRVLRYLSLWNQQATLYDVSTILSSLNMTQKELRQICILSGTDYNFNKEETNSLSYSMKTFAKFNEEKTENNDNIDYYEWLKKNDSQMTYDFDILNKIYTMFDLENEYNKLEVFKKIKIENGPMNKEEIKKILWMDGFIFPFQY